MRKSLLRRFNMIEIVLALGVAALGMTAVMALLPPALDASRNAANDAIAAEIVSQVTSYIELQAKIAGDRHTDQEWLSAMESNFSSSATLSSPETFDYSGTLTTLPAPFQNFCVIAGTVSQPSVLTYRDSNGVPLANVLISYSDIPNVRNYAATGSNTNVSGYTHRPGKRFYIVVTWPAEAPVDADNRQKRSFVYEIMRPAPEI